MMLLPKLRGTALPPHSRKLRRRQHRAYSASLSCALAARIATRTYSGSLDLTHALTRPAPPENPE